MQMKDLRVLPTKLPFKKRTLTVKMIWRNGCMFQALSPISGAIQPILQVSDFITRENKTILEECAHSDVQ